MGRVTGGRESRLTTPTLGGHGKAKQFQRQDQGKDTHTHILRAPQPPSRGHSPHPTHLPCSLPPDDIAVGAMYCSTSTGAGFKAGLVDV
jgi:hypothetical protein